MSDPGAGPRHPHPGEPAPSGRARGPSPPIPEAAPPSSPPPPPRPRSCLGTFWALVGVLVGGVYLLNPTLGLFELLPDNAPGFGNLDEAGAAALLIFGLRYLFARRR